MLPLIWGRLLIVVRTIPMYRKACGLELVIQAARLSIRLFRRDQPAQPDFRHDWFLLDAELGLPFAPSRGHAEQMQRFQLCGTINGHGAHSAGHRSDCNQPPALRSVLVLMFQQVL